MDKLNQILGKVSTPDKVSNAASRFAGLSRFVKDNHLPRYILLGVVTIKLVSVYDKFKQIVAINQMQASLMAQ